jgi:hypothetical protein
LGLKLGLEDPEQWLEDCPDRISDNWEAFYRLNPFGGEQEMLARITSLLYVIAMQNCKAEAVCKASDSLMQALMPSDWVGRKEIPKLSIDQHMQQFEAAVAKAFG